MEEVTQEIIRTPRRGSLLWIGLFSAAALTSWLICILFSVVYTGELELKLTIYGTSIATVVTVIACTVAGRYVIQEASASDHRALCRQAGGEYNLVMAQLHTLNRTVEEIAARGAAERQQLSTKLSKLGDAPGYWDGYADGVEQSLTGTDNVRQLHPHPRPRNNN